MKEYIERDGIEYPYMTMSMYGINSSTCKAYNEGVKAVEDAIKAMPKADVVEVVRCKDCRYCEMVYPCKEIGIEAQPRYFCCIGHKPTEILPVDFCSCGERKGDGE